MASLALGAIGGFMFGPIGFLAGSLIGNLLFPGKQEGPRLTNLRLQDSSFGAMIPLPYGTIRTSGQVVWQTDLKEHKHTSGGKGGPEVTTYTYSASFAVKICKGPIVGVLRIWANGTIIYDVTAGSTVDNTQIPVTQYPGIETADPDPTMESVLGVGNVPAFRDDAACVFTDWDLGNYGNTLPQLSFEVFASGGPIPYRVSTFTMQGWGTQTTGVTYDAASGQITARLYANAGPTGVTYDAKVWLVDGTAISDTGVVNADLSPNGNTIQFQNQGLNSGFACMIDATASPNQLFWYKETHSVLQLTPGFTAVPAGFSWVQNGYLFTFASLGSVRQLQRYTLDPSTGIPSASPTAAYSLPTESVGTWRLCGDSANRIYWFRVAGGGADPQLIEFDDTLTLKRQWNQTDLPAGVFGGAQYTIYNGVDGLVWANTTGTGIGASFCTVWRIEDPGTTWPQLGTITLTASHSDSMGLVRFHNGLCATRSGVISLDPPQLPITLASIVRDLSLRAGLTDADIDVSQLTQLVDGYLVTTQADCRADIEPLRSAYFFDGVEQQGLAVFVNRGAAPVVTIPDNDLAAQQLSEQPPPLVEIVRQQEVELPAIVDVSYYNVDAQYQRGTQETRRQVTMSQATSAVELAIAMSDAKGKQIANVLLFGAWAERMQFKFRTSRKYDYLEPTDPVIVHGYTMRITTKKETLIGVLEFEALGYVPSLYTAAPVGNATSGASGQPVVTNTQATRFLPLDIPLLVDTDSQDGFYAAMAGNVDNTWGGANLYISRDAGATYAQISSLSIASVIGTSSNALGDFSGGNMFDESNSLTVVIGPGGGTLASVSELAVLNGANKALIGSEIIQFKNAVLAAPNTYLLSGLLRGRRGTEFETVTHVAGELFVFMPSTADVVLTFGDLGQVRVYKAVTFSTTLAGTTPTNFLCNGVSLRPYSPTLLMGAPNAATDIVIDWTRRTRIGGAWADFTDVPVSEPSELYVLQVWNATYNVCARVVTGLTSPAFTYTAAMQVADFSRIQQTVYISVAQLGTFGLGTQENAAIAGAGSFIDAPAHPVQPFNTAPPPMPPTGGGCIGGGTVTNVNVAWGSGGGSFFTPSNFGPGDAWVFKFAIGATPGNYVMQLLAFEFGGPPTPRNHVVSLSPCGAPLIPSAHSEGNIDISVSAYTGFLPNPQDTPQFQPNTTYYVTITTDGISEMGCNIGFKLKGS